MYNAIQSYIHGWLNSSITTKYKWQLLVTKQFGCRFKCLSEYIYTNTNMEPFLTCSTLYHCTSSLLEHTTLNSTHVRLMEALLWPLFFMQLHVERKKCCAVHQLFSHIWGFLKWNPLGCSPFASAVANAVTKMLQSVDPLTASGCPCSLQWWQV